MKILGTTYCECCGNPIGEFWGTKAVKILAVNEKLEQLSGGVICDDCYKNIFPKKTIENLIFLKVRTERR